jgi:CRP-like cAMP-binding protein
MSMLLEGAAIQRKIGLLPVSTFEDGETVLAAGSTTGSLLILKEGKVEVVRDGIRIDEVSEPGAVFGELAVLLGQPHSADVRSVGRASFHAADAATFLRTDPVGALYVATVMARRLDRTNQILVEARQQLEAGQPRRRIIAKLQQLATSLNTGTGDPDLAAYTYPHYY